MMFHRLCALTFMAFLALPAQSEQLLDGLQIGTGSKLTIVIFHGDEGNGGDPTSNFAFGAEIARRLPEATIHMLLRPGYKDPWGRESAGENYGRRDQYTLSNASIIAENITRLKGEAPLIAIGHSGGAAQLALALSMEENLVDEAILVSCPCDLDLWKSMNPNWPGDVLDRSTSATRVAPPVLDHLSILVGEHDTITPSELSENYIEVLITAGVSAELMLVEGGDHAGNRELSSAWMNAVFAARDRLLN